MGSNPSEITKKRRYVFITLEEQIIETEKEFNNYKNANFANPLIIEYLESVLKSLKELNDIKNGKERN